jgi:protein-S-isoprenylcysteine O-methyltransferase Ste14
MGATSVPTTSFTAARSSAMRTFYSFALPALWLAWCIYWWVVARDVKPVIRREGVASRAGHILPLVVAVLLLVLPALPFGFLSARILPATRPVFFTGLALVVAGLLFSVWARVYLGRNWGMPMSQKADPELVTTGPYRRIRHPIYSGIILGMVGTAIAVSPYWLIAVAIVGAYFLVSAVVEERTMAKLFPAAYPPYQRATKILIPYVL